MLLLFGQYYIHYLLSIFNKLGRILTIYLFYLFLLTHFSYLLHIFNLYFH
jgi:hypothetical protein